MARPVSDLTKFIRALPNDVPVAEVIAKAKAAGHETSESNVSRVRKMATSKPASKAKSVAKAPAKKAANEAKKPVAETAATAKPSPLSKSDFIRSQPASMSPTDVVAAAKAAGIEMSRNLVYVVRGSEEGKAAAKKTAGKSPAKKATASKTSAKKTAPKKKSASKTVSAAPKRKTSSKKVSPKRTAMASKRTATAAKPGASKADFVRERGHLSPREIVEDANAHGLKFDPSYVYKVRGYDKATASKKAPASKKTPSSKPAVTTPAAPASTSKATAPNGTHSSSGAKVEGLLRAVAAELGLGRAIDILQGERARVRAVIGG